ncbi:MAG: relaxase/mobilization nuclease domain-containing protein, partial [Frankia sp.]
MVAAWTDVSTLGPGVRKETGEVDPHKLGQLLVQPFTAMGGGADRPVWHVSVRAAPTDRILSDSEWAQVALDVVEQAGFGVTSDRPGCRWVAVRHADDHIHVVLTLAREDGTRVWPHNDFYAVGRAIEAAEIRYGLRQVRHCDRASDPRPARVECETVAPSGGPVAARVALARGVRAAVGAGANDPESPLAEPVLPGTRADAIRAATRAAQAAAARLRPAA